MKSRNLRQGDAGGGGARADGWEVGKRRAEGPAARVTYPDALRMLPALAGSGSERPPSAPQHNCHQSTLQLC
jgi:hypothetical protein